MISLNIIRSYRDVIAVCDASILGKRFEEQSSAGKGIVRQLDVKENFYRGEEVSEEKAIEIMKRFAHEDATFNIAGHEAVTAALKAEVISKESIGKIQGIPFALVLL